MTTLSRKLTHWTLIGLTALSVLFGAVAPAFAQEATPPAPAANAERRNARLARLWERALAGLERQAENLAKAGEAAGRLQDRIAQAQSAGQDTAALEAALAAYQGQLAEAQAAHAAAQALAQTHAGFDADGQVTDADQARATLAGVTDKMLEARAVLQDAQRDLRQAARAFRQDHPRPTPTPQP